MLAEVIIKLLLASFSMCLALIHQSFAECVDGAKIETYNWAYSSETTIAKPPHAIWPYLLDLESWMTDYNFSRRSGDYRAEGEMGIFSFRDHSEGPEPHYFLYQLIEVDPNNQLVIKYFSDQGGAFGQKSFIAFETIKLLDNKGSTRLIFESFTESKNCTHPKDWASFFPNYIAAEKATIRRFWSHLNAMVMTDK